MYSTTPIRTHSAGSAPDSPLSASCSWEGAMISDSSGESLPFSLSQSGRRSDGMSAPTIQMADAAPEPVRVLDGASRTIVALVESAQLLIDARVRSGRLVGHWLRRDDGGRVIASGPLVASRAC